MTNNNRDPRTRRALVMSGAAMTGVLTLAGCDLSQNGYTDEQKEQIENQMQPVMRELAEVAIDGSSVVRVEKETNYGRTIAVTIGSAPSPAPRYEARVEFDVTDGDVLEVDNVGYIRLSHWKANPKNPGKMTIYESIVIDEDGDGSNPDSYLSIMSLNDKDPMNENDDIFISNMPHTPAGATEPDLEAALKTGQGILEIINNDYLPRIVQNQ